jgi:hypothetical protein
MTKQIDGKTIEGCTALVRDPLYSHTRMGDGCWRDVVWIYHTNANSPSGVVLVGSTSEKILLQCRKEYPLPPFPRY